MASEKVVPSRVKVFTVGLGADNVEALRHEGEA